MKIIDDKVWKDILSRNKNQPEILLSNEEEIDLHCIGTGIFNPLNGFMNKKEYTNVIDDMRLPNGEPWTIPIVLSVSLLKAREIKENSHILLKNNKGNIIAVMHVQEKFTYDIEKEAKCVYKTVDLEHPGVFLLNQRNPILLGGEIFYSPTEYSHKKIFYHTPEKTKKIFKEKGWKTIVGFQTRNPIHKAHEYIHRCIMEIYDGLFINPITTTKKDDIPENVRISCYVKLICNYYPKNKYFFSMLHAVMRYAGPREAIHHAIMRRNFGCTHFIVGRDHAGVGNYYKPYEAQEIFSYYKNNELKIKPIFFEDVAYCKKCEQMTTKNSCTHNNNNKLFFSGTKIREMLLSNKEIPKEIAREGIIKILKRYYNEK